MHWGNEVEMRTESQNFNEKLLRKKDVANLLACSVCTIERLVAAGRLTCVRIRGAVRFRESEVSAIINGGAS